MVALVLLGLAAGASAVVSVQDRAALVDEVTTRSGPLVVAAQDLYRYLSDADATAASAFLTDGPEPPELRERYETDIAQAGAALATVSSGVNEGPAAAAVAMLSIQLPIYTGLVETARAYNRQGLPVGAAYLREASGVMRERLLPAAEELFQAVSEQLDDARDSAAAFPWLAVLLGTLAVASLLVAQLRLLQRTNRMFNIGLLVASVAALAALLWLVISWASASGHLSAGDRDGSAQVAILSEARIAALQARSDEAHTLVARGAGVIYEEHYQEVMATLSGTSDAQGLLARAKGWATDEEAEAAVDAAIAGVGTWQEVHAELRRLDDEGDHAAAVALAIDAEQDSAGSAFRRVDEALGAGIAHGSERFGREAARAGDALGGSGVGLAMLTLVLLVGVVGGIQQRLAEYR